MRISIIAFAAAGLLSPASAFYPYQFPDDRGTPPSARSVQPLTPIAEGTLRIPLTRVPVRRQNRYTIHPAVSSSQKNSVGIDQDGTDFSYFCSINLGTSKEPYHMLLDSAASNTWVMGADCNTEACQAHNTFGTTDSSSLKMGQKDFSITYGTGKVSGKVGTDTAHFGGFDVPIELGIGSEVSSEFLYYPMDGILGVGRTDLATGSDTVGASSIIDVLANQKLIKAKVFGVALSRFSESRNDGELNLGAPNPSRYDGDLSYISAIKNTDGFWEIPVDDAAAEGKSLGLTGRTAIIDTGTSFILMPNGDAAKLHDQIPGSKPNQESFLVPCDSKKNLGLVFNKVTYTISYRDYVGAPDQGMCRSNIIGRQTFGPKQWLVGDVFLKNVYTVFDHDSQRIGFGVKKAGQAIAAAVNSTDIPSNSSSSSASGSTSGSSATASPDKQGAAAATRSASGSLATIITALLLACYY